jgi:hypothetical protein
VPTLASWTLKGVPGDLTRARPLEVRPLVDDPAVPGAIRVVLAGRPADAVSTLVGDAVHFAGAVTYVRGGPGPGAPARVLHDPFTRVHPGRVLIVDGGVLARQPPPAGPVMQGYHGKP